MQKGTSNFQEFITIPCKAFQNSETEKLSKLTANLSIQVSDLK